MKIGYPCINWKIGCKGDRTFRLKSYSERRLVDTAQNNLDCLLQMLRFNVEHDILFFRITSDLIPFASHPICQFDWLNHFRQELAELGYYIRSHDIRVSMHPGQFTVINTPDTHVLKNSVSELLYHAQVLDAMELDTSAKIQIHVGGVYGDKEKSLQRFVERYNHLEDAIRQRLVVENDDRMFTLQDCLRIHADTEIPILLDVLHHELNNSGESTMGAITQIHHTWKDGDGLPMVDYSYHELGQSKVSHTESIDPLHFQQFLRQTRPFDFDIMLEIKDKEKSALKAVQLAKEDDRFFNRRIQD